MKVTYCPPAKAAGHYLDDLVFFLRCWFPESTARKLAQLHSEVLEMSDEAWAALKAYLDRHYENIVA